MRQAKGAVRLAATLGAALATVCLAFTAAANSLQRLEPQPAADALRQGLSVVYHFNFFRHVREIEEWKKYREGTPGPVISQLDYNVGQGNVLTSGKDEGVGAEISGLIHLEKPGTYAFAVQSNDGVRVEIGGLTVIEDPDVHADRFSEIVQVEVAEPGWYALDILYFERKNTATLELYWQPPGVGPGTMPLVPAEVLAHLKAE